MPNPTKKEQVTSYLVDAREASELLLYGRPPKQISYLKKIPYTGKLRQLINAAQSKLAPSPQTTTPRTTTADPQTSGVWSEFGKAVLRGATSFAVGRAATKMIRQIVTPTAKAVSNLQKLGASASLGADIIEEVDALRLSHPLMTGSSVDRAQAGAQLVDTAAHNVIQSLIIGVPIGRGISSGITKVFKTLGSLKKSPRYFQGRAGASSPPGRHEAVPVTSPTAVIPAQCGLLQDEIAYRLTLLAENVYEPIAAYAAQQGLPPLVILEALRADNTGTSPHERGEAIDITIGDIRTLPNQGEILYNLAKWCRDNILYDQLILCYGEVGGGQSWIHVTFTPDTLRRQVYTKPFNDVHVNGLFQYGQYTDASAKASAQSEFKGNEELSQTFMGILAARDSKTSPIPLTTSPFASISNDASSGVPGVDPQAGTYVPDDGLRSLVLQVAGNMLSEPEWRAQIGQSGHNSDFLREVVRRCHESGAPQTGTGAIGLNASSGDPTAPSVDTIAILNPTGNRGYGSWTTSRRVQMVTVLLWSTTPQVTAGWLDMTVVGGNWSAGDLGGGFIPLGGVPDTGPSGGTVPTPGEIAALVTKYFAEEPKQQRPRSEWEVDYSAWDLGGFDYAEFPLFREEMQRALRVTIKTAQALSVRFPEIGIAMHSGGVDVDYPGFPGPRYRHKTLLITHTGPAIEIMSGIGPDPDYSLDEESPGPEGAAQQWRSPFTGA